MVSVPFHTHFGRTKAICSFYSFYIELGTAESERELQGKKVIDSLLVCNVSPKSKQK